MSVRRAQQEIDSSEFVEWIAYHSISPFGDERADIRNAMQCLVIAQSMGGAKNAKIEDFMPMFGNRRKREMTVDQMRAALAPMKAFARIVKAPKKVDNG